MLIKAWIILVQRKLFSHILSLQLCIWNSHFTIVVLNCAQDLLSKCESKHLFVRGPDLSIHKIFQFTVRSNLTCYMMICSTLLFLPSSLWADTDSKNELLNRKFLYLKKMLYVSDVKTMMRLQELQWVVKARGNYRNWCILFF